MSGDKKGSGQEGPGKRPRPTIEGTATEVGVEAGGEAAREKEAISEKAPAAEKPDTGETPETEPEEDAAQTRLDRERLEAPDADRVPAGRSYAAVLFGGLISLLTHALAGLIGGLAVLLAVVTGYLPIGAPEDDAGLGQFEDRIAKLESAPRPPDNTAALTTMDRRLAALESKTDATQSELKTLSARLAQLEASFASMAEAAKDGGSVAGAAVIGQLVNEAEQRLDARIKSEIQSALAGAAGPAADAGTIDALKDEIAGIDAKLKALAEAKLGSDDNGQLQPEITDLDERLGRIEATLPALAKAVDEEAAETKKATLAIALANLRDAVNQGRPYTSELSTLAVLSPGAVDLGRLLDYEETGIPTVRELTVSFEALREKALAARSRPDDDTIVDRLLGSAESLVKIKRIDEDAEGTSPDAVLARANAKLSEGDLTAAVKDVETLKEPMAETFADWLGDAKARLDAPATLRRLQDILLVSLGGTEAGQKKTEEQSNP